MSFSYGTSGKETDNYTLAFIFEFHEMRPLGLFVSLLISPPELSEWQKIVFQC